MLTEMSRGKVMSFGALGIVKSVETTTGYGIELPSGLVMRYDDLQYEHCLLYTSPSPRDA